MPASKNRVHRYSNAIRVKFPGRSLTAEVKPDGNYWLDICHTIPLEERGQELEAPVNYGLYRGRIGKLTISLSPEAMEALTVLCYEVQRSKLVPVKKEAK